MVVGLWYFTVRTSYQFPMVTQQNKDCIFKPHSTKLEDQIVEYADWAIRQFMQEARKQPWFENTSFVLCGLK